MKSRNNSNDQSLIISQKQNVIQDELVDDYVSPTFTSKTQIKSHIVLPLTKLNLSNINNTKENNTQHTSINNNKKLLTNHYSYNQNLNPLSNLQNLSITPRTCIDRYETENKITDNSITPRTNITNIERYETDNNVLNLTNGKVVLVRSKITKQKFAMKTIKIQNNEFGLSKELEEMEFLKGIVSPTVIKLNEYSNDETNLYLILEYAESGTLSDVIKNYAQKKDIPEYIPDDLIISWITEIILGIYHIHEIGLLHRDIKSENLFLSKNVVKIGDLGAARALGEGARAATMVGTTYYMSPEVMNNQAYRNIIDIWSAGVVFFELLTNTLPFKGYDAEEIKKKVGTLDYDIDLIPKTRNPELAILLKKMLVLKPEERWSALQCLQFPLINERLNKLLENNVLEMDKETKEKLLKIKPKFENIKVSITDKEKEHMIEYFNLLEKANKIDVCSIKHVYNPGFFKTKVSNVITGNDLDTTITDLHLKQKDVEELLERNYIVNILNNSSKELDCSDNVYYKVITQDTPNVDNSLKYPFEQAKEDPLTLSINCLYKIDKVLTSINELVQTDSENIDENVLKLKISTNKDYIDFLVEIRKLRLINLSKCTKDQKLATMLNLYMTMFRHHQIKGILINNQHVSSMMEVIMSMFYKQKPQIEVVYDIGGNLISLFEMKHLVIRRNKKPYEHYYFNVGSSSDPRIQFINETNQTLLQKLLLICIDPIDNIDDYNLNFSYFDDTNLADQIDNRCKQIFQDNITINSNQITIPKFLMNYQTDFGTQPGDMIKFLLKFNTDPDVKSNYVIKSFNENKVQISWT